MKSNELAKAAVAVCVQAHLPVLMVGEPGVGKTKFMTQLADVLGWPLEVFIASIHEPSDLGFPYVPGGTLHGLSRVARRLQQASLPGLVASIAEALATLDPEPCLSYLPPKWAVRLAEAGKGIIFFDEITLAPPDMQAALLRVFLEGVVGECALPPTVSRVAAANPTEQVLGGWDLTPPLANRVVHIQFAPPDVGTWSEGVLTGWSNAVIPILPPTWEAYVPAILSEIAAYLRRNPSRLQAFPESRKEASGPWPSCRSWDMLAARALAAARAIDWPQDQKEALEEVLLAGAVGPGASLGFFTWRREQDLPDPHALLRDPDSFELPRREDLRYVVLTSVVAVAVGLTEDDPTPWVAAWRILGMAADQGAPDSAAVAARVLVEAGHPEWIDLVADDLQKFDPLLKLATQK